MEKFISDYDKCCAQNRVLRDVEYFEEMLPFVRDGANKDSALAMYNEVRREFDRKTMDYERCILMIPKLNDIHKLIHWYSLPKNTLYEKLKTLEHQITEEYNNGVASKEVYDATITQTIELLDRLDNSKSWEDNYSIYKEIESINEDLFNLYYKES